MNAPRIALERIPSALFRRLQSRSTRPCQHALRQFSQSPLRRAPENVQTAEKSGYQPYPFSRPPAQPREDDVPETSIANPVPRVHGTRPPPRSQRSAAASVSEQEAQKTKPAPDRKRKFRPRKAAMKLTPSAVEQLRTLLDQPEPKLIKVGVRNRGCSGLQYHLEYVDRPGAFDEEVEQDGVKVLIDSKALFSIIGSEMDWVEDKLNQRFIFRNPNIKEQCGCGESFMV